MISEHKFIKMRDDVELHAEIREVGSRVWFIATHGIGEHLGRHSYIPELFGSDFNIIQYDLRGHGRSMGEPAHIVDFEDFQKDLGEIINYIKKKYKIIKWTSNMKWKTPRLWRTKAKEVKKVANILKWRETSNTKMTQQQTTISLRTTTI